jgi:hypothetical protein
MATSVNISSPFGILFFIAILACSSGAAAWKKGRITWYDDVSELNPHLEFQRLLQHCLLISGLIPAGSKHVN